MNGVSGRLYSVTFAGTLANAGGDVDLFSIQPAALKPVRLRGFRLSQTSDTTERLRITVLRLPSTFTVGSGGNLVTAAAPISDDQGAVWSAVVRTNDATVATTSGTAQTLDDLGWSIDDPLSVWYEELEACPRVRSGQGLIIRLETTVADDITANLRAIFEEGDA